MSDYKYLFQPLKINKYTYKNRIVAGPMLFGLMYQQKELAELQYRNIEDRARGGAAAVEVGETSINGTDAERLPMFTPVDYTRYSGPDFEGFQKYADVIKKHGAVALIELFHAGCEKTMLPGHPNPRGPVGYTRDDGVVVEQMDERMMKKACEDFATAAAFVKAAGFDGVLTHSGHGWLFSQFLSPLTNTRDDKYGGSLENRTRFPIEIFQKIRERVGSDFIIEARINGRDGVPGGIEPEEVGQFCHMLEGVIDSVHISAGLYSNPVVTNQFSSMFVEHGCNAGLSAIVKKYTSLPVGVIGGINSPELAERIIADGKADFVILARQMIADPEFPIKARNKCGEEIRRCIRCFTCFTGSPEAGYVPPDDGKPFMAKVGSCSINPKANLPAAIRDMPKPKESRRVLVVGGGVAGMQAAITADERGHQVTLVEKNDKLGGVLNFTDIDVNKGDLRNFKNLLVNVIQKSNVTVNLNTEVDPEYINKVKPEAIILALGATPLAPSILGIGGAVHALKVYEQANSIGKSVIIVGGGLVGCETGLHLAKTGHNVTIIEMLKRLSNESFGMYREALMLEMDKYKVTGKTRYRCSEITNNGVWAINDNSVREFFTADTVVYALGMKPNSTEKLRAVAGNIQVFEAGDCVKPGKVGEAVSEGFTAAMAIT
jgi:2,4-dienoyl-CoA reductase-like NADH-dependent reductase (Old Yellow Enzyme family)/thioredoxin reductase